MKKNILLLVFVFMILTSCSQDKKAMSFEINSKLISSLGKQFTVLVESVQNTKQDSTSKIILVSPRSLDVNGDLKMVPSKDWCSGFFPGSLWYFYELNGEETWKQLAETYTEKISDQQWNGTTHDMGFKMFCSFGNGYRITKDTLYRDILIQSAKTLITRFNPKVGCLRSWDHHSDNWDFPVIIDNMMNLELLYWASKETGDSIYSEIATTHAKTTLKNHFRNDNSSYHVVDYNPETGAVEKKQTHQGYADESAWGRGQAWGLYGYTMAYRETKDTAFLNQAIAIATFILNHPNMPEDLIPYWDFNAPNIPNEPRDVSAAAVIASALLELSEYVPEKSSYYKEKAMTIVKNLSSTYLSKEKSNHGFLLEQSTGSKPSNSEVNVPLIYADYYYLEALTRINKYSKIK